MTRPHLRDFKVKENDLVLMIYDNPELETGGALVLGRFVDFIPEHGLEWFRAHPCITINKPERKYFGLNSTIRLNVPKFFFGDLGSLYIPSAERIYVGAEKVGRALEDDSLAKELLAPYLVGVGI